MSVILASANRVEREKTMRIGVIVFMLLATTLMTGCAIGPSSTTFDSPIGSWNERHETTLGSVRSSKVTIIDETRAIFTNPAGRIEFYEIDEQGRWKGYWIVENGLQACSQEKGGSVFWGEQIYQFNETYNRYKGSYDYCGLSQKYSVSGVR